uniref:Uncharacterized protein n=1 Tax=Wuchereria bancrofti TaxID=6293 RepID=A0A1I8ER70_WUCBA
MSNKNNPKVVQDTKKLSKRRTASALLSSKKRAKSRLLSSLPAQISRRHSGRKRSITKKSSFGHSPHRSSSAYHGYHRAQNVITKDRNATLSLKHSTINTFTSDSTNFDSSQLTLSPRNDNKSETEDDDKTTKDEKREKIQKAKY